MVIVEIPKVSIEAEIERLKEITGPNSQIYARGAINALKWILEGDEQPSMPRMIGSMLREKNVH